VLIYEYTIHTLTFLPQSRYKPSAETLAQIWKLIQFLMIDEISMISALLLSQISQCLCQAKAWDLNNRNKPFGGVNIIFSGDFSQLRSVCALPVFMVNGQLCGIIQNKYEECRPTIHRIAKLCTYWGSQ
jgi:PIF1-like helicase